MPATVERAKGRGVQIGAAADSIAAESATVVVQQEIQVGEVHCPIVVEVTDPHVADVFP